MDDVGALSVFALTDEAEVLGVLQELGLFVIGDVAPLGREDLDEMAPGLNGDLAERVMAFQRKAEAFMGTLQQREAPRRPSAALARALEAMAAEGGEEAPRPPVQFDHVPRKVQAEAGKPRPEEYMTDSVERDEFRCPVCWGLLWLPCALPPNKTHVCFACIVQLFEHRNAAGCATNPLTREPLHAKDVVWAKTLDAAVKRHLRANSSARSATPVTLTPPRKAPKPLVFKRAGVSANASPATAAAGAAASASAASATSPAVVVASAAGASASAATPATASAPMPLTRARTAGRAGPPTARAASTAALAAAHARKTLPQPNVRRLPKMASPFAGSASDAASAEVATAATPIMRDAVPIVAASPSTLTAEGLGTAPRRSSAPRSRRHHQQRARPPLPLPRLRKDAA